MSTTVTCKRIAATFQDQDGQQIFVLYEVAYESNVHPHTKRLSTIHIGDLHSSIQRIFEYAGAVEGGMLNSPDRSLTPERYIKSWINAIKRPYALDASKIITDDFYAYNKEHKRKFLDAVKERGLPPTIVDNYDLIMKHYMSGALPTLFSDEGQPYGEQDQQDGYKPVTSKPLPLPEHRMMKLEAEHECYYGFLDANGKSISQPEWQYRVMGDFVENIATTELHHPGTYKTWIPAFRERLRDLPITDPARVTCTIIPVEEGDSEYRLHDKKELSAKYGTKPFTLDTVALRERYYILNGPFEFQVM